MKNFVRFTVITSLIILFVFLFKPTQMAVSNQPVNLTTNSWPNIVIPSKLSFSGESVPLENFDVRESLEMELLAVANWHSRTFLLLKRANRWFPLIERILKQHNIPDDFKYLAVAESGLINDISPAGARGVWQFMESTAIEFGLEVNENVDERYHLEKSTEAASKYLERAYEKFGSWSLVAASYNMGSAALDRIMKAQGEGNYYDLLLNQETGKYVYRILAIKLILENPMNYGYYLKPSDLHPILEYDVISVDTSVADLALFAKAQQTNYKILKYYNPWLRQTDLKNKSNKTYLLHIPKPNGRANVYEN